MCVHRCMPRRDTKHNPRQKTAFANEERVPCQPPRRGGGVVVAVDRALEATRGYPIIYVRFRGWVRRARKWVGGGNSRTRKPFQSRCFPVNKSNAFRHSTIVLGDCICSWKGTAEFIVIFPGDAKLKILRPYSLCRGHLLRGCTCQPARILPIYLCRCKLACDRSPRLSFAKTGAKRLEDRAGGRAGIHPSAGLNTMALLGLLICRLPVVSRTQCTRLRPLLPRSDLSCSFT